MEYNCTQKTNLNNEEIKKKSLETSAQKNVNTNVQRMRSLIFRHKLTLDGFTYR